MPFVMLAEAGTSAFNVTTALETAKSIMTWIFDVVKSEPILAAAFVCGILVPVGFGVVRGIKGASKH